MKLPSPSDLPNHTGIPPVARPHPASMKSVRTTLNLDRTALTARDHLAKAWGTTSKEVLDAAADICERLEPDSLDSWSKSLADLLSGESIRRTHVLTVSARDRLNSAADRLDESRDSLLSTVLLILFASEVTQAEKQKEAYRRASEDVARVQDELDDIERTLLKSLRQGDPVTDFLGHAIVVLGDFQHEIEQRLSDDPPLEPNTL